MQDHGTKVNKISSQVKNFYQKGEKIRIYHGNTNSTRKDNFKKEDIVDVSTLDNVLEINKEERYAVVEPNVSMDKLVDACIKFNMIPPIVMEFPGITVGGGIQGGAGESSSFKFGAFHETCLEYEIVLGDGSIVNASDKENSDLFYGIAGSYGTLGVLTKIKIRLIPSSKYVLLTYKRTIDFKTAVEQIEAYTKSNVNYVDGIIFSKDKSVVTSGTLTDSGDYPISTFTKSSDDWFYLHADKVTKNKNEYQELVPIVDYLFRYDRGGFWVGTILFKRNHIPFNKATRFLLNRFLHTRALFRALHALNISQLEIIQDFSLPIETGEEMITYSEEHTGIYPIWLCPLRVSKNEDRLSPAYIKTSLVLDIGLWGNVREEYSYMLELNRELEEKLTKLGGKKVLYAHSYYPKDEFWKIYDKDWYENLRKKYNAEKVFYEIYEKTYVNEKYDISIRKGLQNILTSPSKIPVKS